MSSDIVRVPGMLPDWMIEERVRLPEGHPLRVVIDPFFPGVKEVGKATNGLDSYGYDLTLGTKFKIFTNVMCTVVDPKAFDPKAFVDFEGDVCLIPPNSFALAESVEYIEVPRDVLVLVLGKSTYARCGIVLNMTPLEPEWRGKVTIEISNTTPLPAKVYANEGIGKMLMISGAGVCHRSYQDRKGVYQDQQGIVLPRV